jgi:hypothetical protein
MNVLLTSSHCWEIDWHERGFVGRIDKNLEP